jgi:hypothetical protein
MTQAVMRLPLLPRAGDRCGLTVCYTGKRVRRMIDRQLGKLDSFRGVPIRVIGALHHREHLVAG